MDLEVVKMTLNRLASSTYMHIFLTVIILDIFIGICKSVILGRASSSIGLTGLLKHSLVILVVIVVSYYLVTFEYDLLAKIFIGYYVTQYIISMIESWGELGLPLPEFVSDRIYKLNDNFNKGVGMNDKSK